LAVIALCYKDARGLHQGTRFVGPSGLPLPSFAAMRTRRGSPDFPRMAAAEPPTLDRRGALATTGAALAALLVGPRAAPAEVRGENAALLNAGEQKINSFLRNSGHPPLKVPSGLAPLALYVGQAQPANVDGAKSRARAFTSTLLVAFVYPSGWKAEAPTITSNGEAGKIAANDYLRGDTAAFAAVPLPPGKDLKAVAGDKAVFGDLISAQIAKDQFDEVKVAKVVPVTREDGVSSAQVDFTYTLRTDSGLTIGRRGVASVQVIDGALVGLVVATKTDRFKKLETVIRQCTDSLRVYKVVLTEPEEDDV